MEDAVETVEESVEEESDVTDVPVEDAEVDEIDDAPAQDTEEEIAPVAAQPEVVRETIVQRKGGFLPMVLGGVVAAGIGVGSAEYIFPDGLPFGSAATEKVDLASALKLQTGRIDDLTKQLDAVPVVDTSALDSAVEELNATIAGLDETVSGFEERIAHLESRPSGDGSGVSAAMENELKALRSALDVQKGELALMIDEAQASKQSAEDTARNTLARAAVTRILVALESGAPFEDALAEVQANSDIEIPAALSQSATDGVPTLAALSETYPDAARAALAAVRSEDTGGGVGNFFAKQFGARSIAPREGDDPDAVLSRVGAALAEGRIADALSTAEALPDTAKAPLSDWMTQADLRLSAAREAEALATSLNSQ